jgi:hypothetical protein
MLYVKLSAALLGERTPTNEQQQKDGGGGWYPDIQHNITQNKSTTSEQTIMRESRKYAATKIAI